MFTAVGHTRGQKMKWNQWTVLKASVHKTAVVPVNNL